MKKLQLVVMHVFLLLPNFITSQNSIIDHNCTKINNIPEWAILEAKNLLHIAYGHTSHGSQITTGMNELDRFMGDSGLYLWTDGPNAGTLDIDDYFVGGDLGNPDRVTWASRTRDYLNNTNNSDVNVVIWSWCGQVSSATESDIDTYLNLMSELESDYPNVTFVYMTGHLDGSGLTGNLHLRNEQIREFCRSNNKVLYDFADIQCYNPDGIYFGDKIPNDNCDYDSDGNGSRDGNWAIEWQNSHSIDIDWYQCSSAHSQSLNANQKAYAAWWLWAILAGWDGINNTDSGEILSLKFELSNNYPNPFNPSTNITFSIEENSFVSLDIYNILGEKVKNLISSYYPAGQYSTSWNSTDEENNNVNSGVYFYKLTADRNSSVKRMLLIK